jgi:hypothetical protein
VRKHQALTQRGLAAKSGDARLDHRRPGDGRSDARMVTVRKLVDALGVKPRELMEE